MGNECILQFDMSCGVLMMNSKEYNNELEQRQSSLGYVTCLGSVLFGHK